MPRHRTFLVLTALTAAALLTLSGCVTVHGEQIRQPAVEKPEAKRVVARFVESNNRVNREIDRKLNARTETGVLAAVDDAGLKVGAEKYPDGYDDYPTLKFRNTRYLIPEQTGWPRWFMADTGTNRSENRWLLAFTKQSAEGRWQAAYLAVIAPDAMPEFARTAEGYVKTVPPGGKSRLLLPPEKLSDAYATLLQDGKGEDFADGAYTSELREARAKRLRTPQYVTQYADAATPEFPPVAVRLKDGGALTFFGARHHQKQTMAEGRTVPVTEDIEPLLDGEAERSIAMELLSLQAVVVPAVKEPGEGVSFLYRRERLVGATGS